MSDWSKVFGKEDCPFCSLSPNNDYMLEVADLKISRLYLNKNQTYNGYCLLIFKDRHVTNLTELSNYEYEIFMQDLLNAQKAIMKVCVPDHINVAALGNIITHLHWHIIPRYKNDVRWGKPIWTTECKDMLDVKLSIEELKKLKEKIISYLS